ncbi:MFS transporter [Halobellus sp. GM3]|uniref:MFS transporter n=1 Tax=Halobellus sp. GM3 TaxID=3458410 RepID=UPI00403DA3B2
MRWQYRHTVLTLCVLAFFVTMAARLAISPIATLVIAEFAISKSLIGLALSGMWLAYALAQFPSGVLGSKYGERSIILVAVGGMSILGVSLAVAPIFPVFVVSCFLIGGFAGLHYPAATTLLTRSFDDPGTVIGIHGFGAPVAGLLTPVAVSWLGITYGWRVALLSVAVVGGPIFALVYLRVRPVSPTTPDTSLRSQLQVGALWSLLARPAIAFTVWIGVMAEFVTQGLLSFLPTFFAEFYGYSTTRSGLLFSAFFLVLGAGGIAMGSLSDRYGTDSTLVVCLLSLASGVLVLLSKPSELAVLAGVSLVGLGACAAIVVQPRIIQSLEEAEKGTGFGLVRSVYMILGAAGPVSMGFLADAFGWIVSLGSLVVVSLAVVVSFAANWWLGFDAGGGHRGSSP